MMGKYSPHFILFLMLLFKLWLSYPWKWYSNSHRASWSLSLNFLANFYCIYKNDFFYTSCVLVLLFHFLCLCPAYSENNRERLLCVCGLSWAFSRCHYNFFMGEDFSLHDFKIGNNNDEKKEHERRRTFEKDEAIIMTIIM